MNNDDSIEMIAAQLLATELLSSSRTFTLTSCRANKDLYKQKTGIYGVFNLNFPEELQFCSFSNQRHNLPKYVEKGEVKGYSNV